MDEVCLLCCRLHQTGSDSDDRVQREQIGKEPIVPLSHNNTPNGWPKMMGWGRVGVLWETARRFTHPLP